MTQKEIAGLFELSEQTISKTLNNRDDIREAWEKGRSELAGLLRQTQIDVAVRGRDAGMLKFLGKAQLHQDDSPPRRSDQLDINVNHRFVAQWGKTPAELGEDPDTPDDPPDRPDSPSSLDNDNPPSPPAADSTPTTE
jgi:hypothetical protein